MNIQPFIGMAYGVMKYDPTFLHTGATASVTVGMTLTNQSNVPADLTIQYDVKSPSGVVLQSGTAPAALSLDTVTTTIPLIVLNQTFTESGEYPLHAVVYNGGVMLSEVQAVFVVLPNMRIEPSRTVAPGVLLPTGTGKVKVIINLHGVDNQ
jgi:hypothetical protein